MRKITPCLWFDTQAEEAATFYTSLFESSRITGKVHVTGARPRADASILFVTFELLGQELIALNGGPEFTFTPAISLFVSCRTEAELDRLWAGLSRGGTVLMEVGAYPFSPRFGWLNDRYGVSWQLSVTGSKPGISPYFLFVGAQHGKAEEAMRMWTGLFDDSRIDEIGRHGGGAGETAGTVLSGRFTLAGEPFMAMDSGLGHPFTFTHGVSFYVSCESQSEIDRLWSAFSDRGTIEECGWVLDRFGVAWQVVPGALRGLLGDGTTAQAERVMRAVLGMKKLDAAALESAARGS
jgi:predicted 3-demethylubiquinone-9 3-methyltransferase (glyoxalase superfamily)